MRYKIYSKDGSTVRCETEKLEYNGQFMGENSVIVSAKSPKHIDFNIDDYVVFRGENFYLANIPTEKKTGDRNTKGDVFQYDNMKFMSVQYELNNADFNDFVGGSQTDISFTAQPNFSFVAATVTDLAQRIQVNMDRYYTGDKKWTIKVDNNYTTSDDNLNKLITISNITCWGALALFKSLYDTNFIVRGRTVTIGGSGSIKDITFKVGAYKGLWDMTRNSQTDQGIVTKLTSYGNTTNIHPRYYSLIGVTVTAKLTAFDHIASSYSLFFLFDLNHTTELNDTVKFNISGSSTSYELQGTWGIYKDYTFGCRGMVESFAAYKVDTTSAIYEDVRAKVLSVGYANTSVTFVSGARKDNISDLSHLSFDVNSKLPNNMNIMNLMLPAFPTQTLAEWVEENKSKYSWLQEYVNQGYTFSTERFYPCIYSKNKDVLGIRPHTEYFTSDDATHKDIYPSLQYFSDNRNQIISVVNADGTPITDEGLFQNGQTPQQIKITIHNLGFNFSEVKMGSTDPKLHMNSGYCGGRDFTIKGYSLDNIILTCDRVKDDSLGKYFPNVNSPLSNGDKFVITDIYMPTTYIDQASVTLLKWSLKWLAKNDYSVFSYQLTPDINFIKRHDDKITDKGTTFYRTVKEGDILLIEDTDIGVTGSITIDQIKITIGDGLLPKYEITLRDTKTVGTVQKIQQQIDAIVSGGVSGGYNSTQVGEIAYSALKDKFLSKVSADTAAGLITFLKGLKLGSNFSIDELGNAILNSISLGTFEHLVKGLGLYKNTSGHWCIECDEAYFRIKAVFEALEIRKMYSSAGNINISPSGSKITRVEWLDASGNITTVAADTVAYKCYFLADDGTTATTNSWQAKDYALCKTFNIKEGVYTNVSNQYYWRKVTDAGSGYITLGNLTGQFDEGSTIPQAGDSVVMRGSDTDGRKSYIEILSNDENAPAILMFADCMGFASKGQNTAIISPEKVQFATKVFKLIDYDNVATPVVIYKGVYDASKVYYYNNSVTYNGSLWVLDGVAVGASAAAGTEPKDGSTVWTKQVSKGSNGTSGVTYWSSPSVLMIDAIKNGGDLYSSTDFSNTVKFYAQIGGVSLTAGTATLSGSAYIDSDMIAYIDTVGQVEFSDDNGIIKEGTINVTVPFTDASGNSYTHDFPIEVKAVVSGKGISSVQVFYLATTVSSVSDYEAFKGATGWTETEQSVSEANPYLWTYQITTYSDGTKVATVPHIIGTYGHDGINGTNGYSLQLNPNQLVVDTADDGKVPDTALPLKCTIIVLKGGSQMATSVSITSNTNCTASASSNVISITAINEETVDGQTISCGSGYVDFTATDTTDNVALSGRVYFSVNVYKVASSLIKNNNEITATVTTFTRKVTDVEGKQTTDETNISNLQTSLNDTKDNLTKTTSRVSTLEGKVETNVTSISNLDTKVGNLTVQSNEISASVSQTSAAKNNLIPNSYIRGISKLYACYSRSMYLTAGTYVFSANGHVSSNMASTRMLKVYIHNSAWTWVRTLSFDASSATACYITDYDRTKDATIYQTITVETDGEYTCEVYDYSDDSSEDTSGSYVVINWLSLTSGSVRMPWSRCESDAEVGQNMLPWAMNEYTEHYGTIRDNYYATSDGTLVDEVYNVISIATWVSGALYSVGNYVIYNSISYRCIKATTSAYEAPTNTTYWTQDIKVQNLLVGTVTVEAYMTYTLSFYAKGSGMINTFLRYSACMGSICRMGGESLDSNGCNWLDAPSEWTKITVNFSTYTSGGSKEVVIRQVGEGSVSIAGVKFEKYGLATDGLSKSDLYATGIDIQRHKIIATSDNFYLQNNSGQISAAVDESGNLSAGSLSTLHKSGSPYIYIKDGILDIFGTVARNIHFGVNSDGMAVLQYYDNSGVLLYDLGPDGIKAKDLQSSQWETLTFVSVETIGYTESNVPLDGAYVEKADAYKLFALNTNYALTTLYKYHAGKLEGTYVKDDTYGFSTADAAKAADGRIFTSKYSGNLCSGTYTYNNESQMFMNTDGLYAKKFVWFSAGSMSSGTWYCTKANYNIVNGLVAN